MSTVADPPITPDELLRMPDGDRYELVDGQLEERDMGAVADWVGTGLAAKLRTFVDAKSLGWAFGDGVGYCIFADDPGRVRKPDASFIRTGKLPDEQLPAGFLTVVPDLVVEVVSPNDSYYAVESKVEEYLDASVRTIWVINPALRMVRVFRQDASGPVDRHAADILSGDDVLPGFSCRVADLFPPSA